MTAQQLALMIQEKIMEDVKFADYTVQRLGYTGDHYEADFLEWEHSEGMMYLA